MHFYEYFEWLCKCADVTMPQAYNGANINKGTVSRWRSAFAEGIETVPSAKAATALGLYFGIPTAYVFEMKWKDNVEAKEWISRGERFFEFRKQSGLSDIKVATIAMLPESDVICFEQFGRPISIDALFVMCDAIGKTVPDICSEPVHKEPLKLDNDIQAAFFGGYADDLTPEERDGLWRDAQDFARFRVEQMRKEKMRKNG